MKSSKPFGKMTTDDHRSIFWASHQLPLSASLIPPISWFISSGLGMDRLANINDKDGKFPPIHQSHFPFFFNFPPLLLLPIPKLWMNEWIIHPPKSHFHPPIFFDPPMFSFGQHILLSFPFPIPPSAQLLLLYSTLFYTFLLIFPIPIPTQFPHIFSLPIVPNSLLILSAYPSNFGGNHHPPPLEFALPNFTFIFPLILQSIAPFSFIQSILILVGPFH